MPSETESFVGKFRAECESERRVNAITRKDIFLVQLDAIAMTNRNVTRIDMKTSSVDRQPADRMTVHLAFLGKTAVGNLLRPAKTEGATDG